MASRSRGRWKRPSEEGGHAVARRESHALRAVGDPEFANSRETPVDIPWEADEGDRRAISEVLDGRDEFQRKSPLGDIM